MNEEIEDFSPEKIWDMWTDACKEENVRKCINKLKNKEIDGFEKVKSWAIAEHFSFRNQKEMGYKTIFSKEMDRSWLQLNDSSLISSLTLEEKYRFFASNIINEFTYLINSGKVFKLSEELKNLFLNTKVELKYKSHLPFKQIFIDLNELKEDNYSWFGIIISEAFIKNFKINGKNKEKNALKIFLVGRDNIDNEPICLWTYICDEGISESERIGEDELFNNNELKEKEFYNKIFTIVLNFLNLINHQEVQIITTSRDIFRRSRNDKNKFGAPDEIEINITGKLNKYIYENTKDNKKSWEIGYRFWVMGHWVNFISERYKQMKGKKIWILPYIKGKGKLIKKEYYVGEKEQCWENEKRMIKLINNIFPNIKILKHNRILLNGFEIDCYNPELKIGFEYNGEQHYNFPNAFHKTKEEFEKQQQRDIEKNNIALEKGIKLITIRYDEPLTEELIINKIKEVSNGN